MKITKCNKAVKRDHAVIANACRIPYYPLVIGRANGSIIEDIDGNRPAEEVAAVIIEPIQGDGGKNIWVYRQYLAGKKYRIPCKSFQVCLSPSS